MNRDQLELAVARWLASTYQHTVLINADGTFTPAAGTMNQAKRFIDHLAREGYRIIQPPYCE